MPNRDVVSKELAEIFKLIAHPDRIQIIENLAREELDVNSLATVLGLSSARVSQHLSLLRARRFVGERRDGRRHFYHLTQPDFSRWIIDGLNFVASREELVSESEIQSVRKLWSTSAK